MDVKTLCLGVLTEGDKTGYEIKRCFEEAFSHFFGAGFGSIYPALADLSRRGLVKKLPCRECPVAVLVALSAAAETRLVATHVHEWWRAMPAQMARAMAFKQRPPVP